MRHFFLCNRVLLIEISLLNRNEGDNFIQYEKKVTVKENMWYTLYHVDPKKS